MKVSLINLGTVNKNKITLENLEIWFSYETPVAYRTAWDQIVCRQNDWSVTTGKLLNELEPDKARRIDGEQFEKQLQGLLDQVKTA